MCQVGHMKEYQKDSHSTKIMNTSRRMYNQKYPLINVTQYLNSVTYSSQNNSKNILNLSNQISQSIPYILE